MTPCRRGMEDGYLSASLDAPGVVMPAPSIQAQSLVNRLLGCPRHWVPAATVSRSSPGGNPLSPRASVAVNGARRIPLPFPAPPSAADGAEVLGSISIAVIFPARRVRPRPQCNSRCRSRDAGPARRRQRRAGRVKGP
jgi:hypothetical protein